MIVSKGEIERLNAMHNTELQHEEAFVFVFVVVVHPKRCIVSVFSLYVTDRDSLACTSMLKNANSGNQKVSLFD